MRCWSWPLLFFVGCGENLALDREAPDAGGPVGASDGGAGTADSGPTPRFCETVDAGTGFFCRDFEDNGVGVGWTSTVTVDSGVVHHDMPGEWPSWSFRSESSNKLAYALLQYNSQSVELTALRLDFDFNPRVSVRPGPVIIANLLLDNPKLEARITTKYLSSGDVNVELVVILNNGSPALATLAIGTIAQGQWTHATVTMNKSFSSPTAGQVEAVLTGQEPTVVTVPGLNDSPSRPTLQLGLNPYDEDANKAETSFDNVLITKLR